MQERPNILVICGRNKRRSRTAEYIFKNDSRFQIRSAGLSAQSNVRLSEKLISWSDIILVMENAHRNAIQSRFRSLELPDIHNLDITDDYEYLNEELINMLEERINETLKSVFNL